LDESVKQISDNRYPWKQVLPIIGAFLGLFYLCGVIGRLLAHLWLLGWYIASLRHWGAGKVRVFDLGDQLEIHQGRDKDSVSLANIDRVIYEKHWGTQICRLHLREPCTFGSEVRFVVSQHWVSPEYDPIADDLHRRSKCCKGDEQAL